jgi:hypothetical protein
MTKVPSAAMGVTALGTGLIHHVPPAGSCRYMTTRHAPGAAKPPTVPAMGVKAPGAGKAVMVKVTGLGVGDGPPPPPPGANPRGTTMLAAEEAPKPAGRGPPSTALKERGA